MKRRTWATAQGYAAATEAAAKIEDAAKGAGKSELEGIMKLVSDLEWKLTERWYKLGQK